jgi:hypothetical protein
LRIVAMRRPPDGGEQLPMGEQAPVATRENREQFIFLGRQLHRRALLRHKATRAVEVAVARVAIEQDRHARRVSHELDDFEHLGLSISPDLDTLLYTLGYNAPESRIVPENFNWEPAQLDAALVLHRAAKIKDPRKPHRHGSGIAHGRFPETREIDLDPGGSVKKKSGVGTVVRRFAAPEETML